MQSNLKRWTAAVLVLLMTASSIGCMPKDPATTKPTDGSGSYATTQPTEMQPTLTEPTSSQNTEPSMPVTIPDPFTSVGNVKVEQLRLDGYDRGWVNEFVAQFSAFATIYDTQRLEFVLDSIEQFGKNVTLPAGYDETFFQENFLVLIPRQSGSGSVQYAADAELEGDMITISLSAKMPEVGTTDMADWLVMVTLPRDKFPEGCQIDLLTELAPAHDSGLDIKDR